MNGTHLSTYISAEFDRFVHGLRESSRYDARHESRAAVLSMAKAGDTHRERSHVDPVCLRAWPMRSADRMCWKSMSFTRI